MTTTSEPRWYHDAIIYEAHVRAFYDSDGDGGPVTIEFQSLSDQPATQEAVAAIVDDFMRAFIRAA